LLNEIAGGDDARDGAVDVLAGSCSDVPLPASEETRERLARFLVLHRDIQVVVAAAPAWLGSFANNFNQLLQNVNQMQISLQRVEARQENARIGRFNHLELARNTGVTTYQAKQKEVGLLPLTTPDN
jgi:hypothetical protein